MRMAWAGAWGTRNREGQRMIEALLGVTQEQADAPTTPKPQTQSNHDAMRASLNSLVGLRRPAG